MSEKRVKPLIAFDIHEATGRPVNDPWPAASAPEGVTYRWLHFDVGDPEFRAWAKSHLPSLAIAALTQSETRPRCELAENAMILNLRGINLNPGQESDDMVSVRMWIKNDLIVSARVRRVFAAEALGSEIAAGNAPVNTATFLARLGQLLTDRIEEASLDLEEATGALEETLTIAPGSAADKLIPVRLKAIKLRRYLAPQRDALHKLLQIETGLVREADRIELREVANRNLRSFEELEAITQRLQVLQDYIFSQRSEETSRNGMILSIVAAIFLPLGFLTGLFGVNIAGMPGMEWPWAFTVLTGISVVIGIALYFLFRVLRWF